MLIYVYISYIYRHNVLAACSHTADKVHLTLGQKQASKQATVRFADHEHPKLDHFFATLVTIKLNFLQPKQTFARLHCRLTWSTFLLVYVLVGTNNLVLLQFTGLCVSMRD